GFPPYCYPSYRTPTFILVGLSPTEHTYLFWTHSNIICTSLMFSGVGLDLVANGFGITNSMMLSGLLLSLPFTLLIVTLPILNAASEYTLKKTVINSIEEQFKGSDPLLEQPNSTINPDSVHVYGREQVV
ncbi:MAG: hypothetical protein ACEY3K_14285, partial [Wolbachia sp.]